MSQAVIQILRAIEELSEAERREVWRAVVQNVPISDDLTDDDFGVLAAESFRTLDREEDARRA